MEVTTVGIDLAKNVFQVHGVDERGKVLLRRQLRREQMAEFFARLSPCLIGMEACGSAHHWARVLQAQGHSVRLIASQFVKPYVKSNKHDAADAAAICEAVARPSMRFVPVTGLRARPLRGERNVSDGSRAADQVERATDSFEALSIERAATWLRCSAPAQRRKRTPAVVENGPAIADQDGFDVRIRLENALDRGDCLCAVFELGVGQEVELAPHVPAYEIARDERRPFQNEGELTRRFAPVHFKHVQTGNGLIPIAEPVLARKREAAAFGAWSAQRGAKLLREPLGATRVVGVRDDDECGATERCEMRPIMLSHWQRVDEDVAAGSDPGHAAKVDVALLVET